MKVNLGEVGLVKVNLRGGGVVKVNLGIIR